MKKEELLLKAYEDGFMSFWANSQRELAEEFAEKLGWKISFVMITAIDADLYFVYKDITCLSDDIAKMILESIPSRSIEKERFLYAKENLGTLNTMIHDSKKYRSIILDDELLTNEISDLAEAVEKFEKNTGLKIEVQ